MSEDLKTTEALQIGLEHARQALARHDAEAQRHSSFEERRHTICKDIAEIERVLAQRPAPQAMCAHRWCHFGDQQPRRRCIDCNELEPAPPRASTEPAEGSCPEGDAIRAKAPPETREAPLGFTSAPLSWGPRQSEAVVKITRTAQPQHGFTHPLYAAAPGTPARLEEAQRELSAALAMFPLDIPGQSFVVANVNNGEPLKADGDTVFFSQKKVMAALGRLRGHLVAAQSHVGDACPAAAPAVPMTDAATQPSEAQK